MKRKHLRKAGLTGAALLGVLLAGCTVYETPSPPLVNAPPTVYIAPQPTLSPQVVYETDPPAAPPPVVYVEPTQAPAVVEIQVESDFYEPLNPYGRWIEVRDYGRCWTPTGVDPGWRPYTAGHWQRTDAGWYWVSDERWGWATYHYGRWHLDPDFGWVWIPQTQWGPAWVAWRDGGGYTGWAPLPPEARIGAGGALEYREETLDPRAFVFVEQRRMLEPQRPQTVIVNNTTIIHNTINITKIQVVNKTVINEGPRPEAIAQASGHKIEVTPARALRTQLEKPAVVARQTSHPAQQGKIQAQVRDNPQSAPKQEPVVATGEPQPVKRKTPEPSVVNSNEKAATTAAPKPAPKPVVTAAKPLQSVQHPQPVIQEKAIPPAKPRTGHAPAVKKPVQPLTPQQKPAEEQKRKEEKAGQ